MPKFTVDLNEENIPRAADILANLYFAGQDGLTNVDYTGALMNILLALDMKKVG